MEVKRAMEAVAVPSRAQELKAEAAAADLEDLLLAWQRAAYKGKKRRLAKEFKKRFGHHPREYVE